MSTFLFIKFYIFISLSICVRHGFTIKEEKENTEAIIYLNSYLKNAKSIY